MAETDFSEYRFTDIEDSFVVPCVGNDPYMAVGIPREGQYAGSILNDVPSEAVSETTNLAGVIDDRWRYMERLSSGGLPIHREHVEVRGDFGFVSPDEFGASKAVYALSDALRGSASTAFGLDMFPGVHGPTPRAGVFGRNRYIEDFPYASGFSGNPTSPWVSVLDIYRLRTYVWGEGPERATRAGGVLPPAYNALKHPIVVFATAKIVFGNPDLVEV